MQYKKYDMHAFGRVMAHVEYPACDSNCYWFGIKVWDSKTGFIKCAEHINEDGDEFYLIEVQTI